MNGHINGFNFKPVVRGVYLGAAGSVDGTVTDTTGMPLEHAMVKVVSDKSSDYYDDEDQYGDDDENGEDEADEKSAFCNDKNNHMVATFTDADGNYKLIGLPEGTYTLACSLEGYENDTITDVTVAAGEATTIDFSLVPVEQEAMAINY